MALPESARVSSGRLGTRERATPILGRADDDRPVGVDVLDVPFTLPAASAKTSAGFSRATCFCVRPLLAVAPVMWASQCGMVLRTDAKSGPTALGSLCSVVTGCGGRFRSSAPIPTRPGSDQSVVRAHGRGGFFNLQGRVGRRSRWQWRPSIFTRSLYWRGRRAYSPGCGGTGHRET
jgi:hypothetical protein